jgi:RNA polymerase sigma factor (sigma-70 family)
VSRAHSGPPGSGWPAGVYLREFEDFDRRFRPTVRAYLRSLDGDVPFLDDAVQDAFFIVARRWQHVRGLTKPQGYLFRIAKQRWVKRSKYRGNRCAALPADSDSSPAAQPGGSDGDHADRVQIVRDALALIRPLPTRQREVVFLSLIAGYDEETVADILTISVGSEKRHRARGLQRLRQINSVQIGMGDQKDAGGGTS